MAFPCRQVFEVMAPPLPFKPPEGVDPKLWQKHLEERANSACTAITSDFRRCLAEADTSAAWQVWSDAMERAYCDVMLLRKPDLKRTSFQGRGKPCVKSVAAKQLWAASILPD
eukprot:5486903-Alexandrium_andersonii.AAC.1